MPSAIGAVGGSLAAKPTLDIVLLSESAYKYSYVVITYQKRTRNLQQFEGILHWDGEAKTINNCFPICHGG